MIIFKCLKFGWFTGASILSFNPKLYTSMNRLLLAVALSFSFGFSYATEPLLSPNAPKDKPVHADSPDELRRAIAPYVEKAKSSYPQAKQRFLSGLPQGQHFFLTTSLHDTQGHEENVFVAVSSIRDGIIAGKIWNNISLVQGYKNGDDYSFAEGAIIDWLITKPDGTEEGNFVGNFLDTYRM